MWGALDRFCVIFLKFFTEGPPTHNEKNPIKKTAENLKNTDR